MTSVFACLQPLSRSTSIHFEVHIECKIFKFAHLKFTLGLSKHASTHNASACIVHPQHMIGEGECEQGKPNCDVYVGVCCVVWGMWCGRMWEWKIVECEGEVKRCGVLCEVVGVSVWNCEGCS